jgi:hypothetical protein
LVGPELGLPPARRLGRPEARLTHSAARSPCSSLRPAPRLGWLGARLTRAGFPIPERNPQAIENGRTEAPDPASL